MKGCHRFLHLASLHSLCRRYPQLRVQVMYEATGDGFAGDAEFRAGACYCKSEREVSEQEREDWLRAEEEGWPEWV